MSSLEIGILTGLGTAICFGIGDFLIARSTRQYSGLYATFWVHLLRLSFVGLMFAGFGWHLKITELGMLLALVSGSILLAGQLAIFHSFKLGPVSIASPFVSGYALVASLLSIIFLHERLHPIQLFAIALLITGAMLASISSVTHRPHKDFWRSPTVLWALVGACCIGTSLFFLAQLAREVGWQSSLFLQGAVVLGGATIGMIFSRKSPLATKPWPFSWAVAGTALFHTIGGLLANYGFASALVAIVAPVASISPLITVGLALYFFKERLSRYQLTGALVVIVALSLLSVR